MKLDVNKRVLAKQKCTKNRTARLMCLSKKKHCVTKNTELKGKIRFGNSIKSKNEIARFYQPTKRMN